MAAPLTFQDDPLNKAKAALRKSASARRHAWPGDRPAAAQEAARHFLKAIPREPGIVVSGYVAMKDELDPAPLLAALNEAGHKIALPVVVGRGQGLVFRRWSAGDDLVAGPLGTHQPGASASVIEPDILIVPLLAFDPIGHRLGFGAGYYDRTLFKLRAAKRVLAVGFAFADQGVPQVPAGPGDQRLDWIVTEKGAETYA